MAKTKNSLQLRNFVVDAHDDGEGYKAIWKRFKLPTATVQSLIKKFKTAGSTVTV